MAPTMSATATMPSSHQWLAVTTTTSTVSTGWARISHRQGLTPTRMVVTPMITAQATCTDGMADSWAATPVPKRPYTDWL